MTEIIQREASSCTLTQLTAKLIPEVIGREIEKATQGIYPLQNVRIYKVYPRQNYADEIIGPHPQSEAPEGTQVRPRCSP